VTRALLTGLVTRNTLVYNAHEKIPILTSTTVRRVSTRAPGLGALELALITVETILALHAATQRVARGALLPAARVARVTEVTRDAAVNADVRDAIARHTF